MASGLVASSACSLDPCQLDFQSQFIFKGFNQLHDHRLVASAALRGACSNPS